MNLKGRSSVNIHRPRLLHHRPFNLVLCRGESEARNYWNMKFSAHCSVSSSNEGREATVSNGLASSRTLNRMKRPMNIQEQATRIACSLQLVQTPNCQLVNFHTVTSCLHFQRLAGRVFLSGRQSLGSCAWAWAADKGAFKLRCWSRTLGPISI